MPKMRTITGRLTRQGCQSVSCIGHRQRAQGQGRVIRGQGAMTLYWWVADDRREQGGVLRGEGVAVGMPTHSKLVT